MTKSPNFIKITFSHCDSPPDNRKVGGYNSIGTMAASVISRYEFDAHWLEEIHFFASSDESDPSDNLVVVRFIFIYWSLKVLVYN